MKNSQTASTVAVPFSPELIGLISYTTSATIHQLFINYHFYFSVVLWWYLPGIIFIHFSWRYRSPLYARPWEAREACLGNFVLSALINQVWCPWQGLWSLYWLTDYQTVICGQWVGLEFFYCSLVLHLARNRAGSYLSTSRYIVTQWTHRNTHSCFSFSPFSGPCALPCGRYSTPIHLINPHGWIL